MAEKKLWGLHAGRNSEADSQFLQGKCIALGFSAMGDMSKIKPDREAFKKKTQEVHPKAKAGAIPNLAGQAYRFVHEMEVGDLVAYPSKLDRMIHLGRVIGEYHYDSKQVFPNLRKVEWLKSIQRTQFSQGALYEIGSAISIFRVKNFADEYLSHLEATTKTKPLTVEEDPTIIQVAEDIEENTRDFILKRLAQNLKGHPFADFVAHLLGAMGYRTRVSPEGPDGGVDILAHTDELGFEPPIIKVQVKSTQGNIGDPDVSALYGKVGQTEFGLLVSLGGFTAQARAFARSKTNLRLISGVELVDLILEHYEEFDSRYKGLLPLKRVYVPEPLDDGAE